MARKHGGLGRGLDALIPMREEVEKAMKSAESDSVEILFADDDEDSESSFPTPVHEIKEKADALGISVDEYMNQVEAYEKQQERQREADELEDLINAGTPESIAKELIASRQQRKQIQQELNDIKAEREADRKEKEKNKEYQDFLKEFPEVNPESIPKEVFEDAESSSLKEAYMKWKLKELEKEISISKTNEKNKKSSVGSTTDTGTTNEKHEKDLFLEGFDE